MRLLDSSAEEPKSKLLRWVVSTLLFVILLGLTAWYFLRYQTEKNTARRFFEALAAGDTKKAYEIWKPGPSYPYELFLEDWGPGGEYGPVKSFRIVAAGQPKNASGVIVTAEVSPDASVNESLRTKEVRVWVERRDQSLSFPP